MLSLTQEAAYSFPKEQRMSKYTLRQYLVPLVLVILSLAILIIGLVTVLQEGNPATPTPAGKMFPSNPLLTILDRQMNQGGACAPPWFICRIIIPA